MPADRFCSECGAPLRDSEHEPGCSNGRKPPVKVVTTYNEEAGRKALIALAALAEAMDGDIAALGDYVYSIRDRELLGWEGPRVKAWSDGCAFAREALSLAGMEVMR